MKIACALAALSLAVALHAQNADPCAVRPQDCATLVSTSAVGQKRIPNTVVDVQLGVLVTRADLPGTQRALAEQSSALLKYLRGQNVQRLISSGVSFNPETRSQKNAIDKTVGYSGSTQVSFRTTPEKAPEILAAALNNGATSIDNTELTATEEEMAAARRELAATATKDAVAQAEAIAQAIGAHTLAVRQVDVNGCGMVPQARPMGMMKTMEAAAPPPPPIEIAAGDQQVNVSVHVTVAVGR